MKLSVAIVNHNQQVLLKQAVTSFINSCKNIEYELIIVDNASADGSKEMVEKVEEYIKAVKTSQVEAVAVH